MSSQTKPGLLRRRTATIAEVQHPAWTPSARGPAGRPLCRRCLAECPGRRRTFCSEECVHFWKLRRSAGYLRGLIRQRDRGVCRACGVDTYALRREADSLRRQCGAAARAAFLRERGFDPNRRTLWDADHHIPIAEGGDRWNPDGIVTLCIPCHRRKTAEQARRRAERRVI